MTNVNNPNGFHVLNSEMFHPRRWPTEASYAGLDGDSVYLNSAGRATGTASGVALGIQVGYPYDSSTNQPITAAASVGADDYVDIYDNPDVKFWAQINTGALADPYTTRSSAACYDVTGSAGAQQIDSGTSVNDTFKIIGPYFEPNGELSAVGSNQKVRACFNGLKHAFGVIA